MHNNAIGVLPYILKIGTRTNFENLDPVTVPEFAPYNVLPDRLHTSLKSRQACSIDIHVV